MLRHIGLVILALSCVAVTGCHVGCCSKRASEKKCPTDIRKMHCWCFGEDALFRYPCGPNRVFYGHKATCWREWPTSASHWRDVHCGPPMGGFVPEEGQVIGWPQNAEPAPVEGGGGVPNPFRDEQPQIAPQPLPPQTMTPQQLPRQTMRPSTTSPPASQMPEVMEQGGQWPEALPGSSETGAAIQANLEESACANLTPTVSCESSPRRIVERRDSLTWDLDGEQSVEYRQWSAFAELGATPPARQELMPEASAIFAPPAMPEPAAVIESPPATANQSRPATANQSRPAVIVESPPAVASASAPTAERDPRWRLVVHDSPDGVPAPSNAGATKFRPPHPPGARGQTPVSPQHQAVRPKASLEEQTRDALQRFISTDGSPRG